MDCHKYLYDHILQNELVVWGRGQCSIVLYVLHFSVHPPINCRGYKTALVSQPGIEPLTLRFEDNHEAHYTPSRLPKAFSLTLFDNWPPIGAHQQYTVGTEGTRVSPAITVGGSSQGHLGPAHSSRWVSLSILNKAVVSPNNLATHSQLF